MIIKTTPNFTKGRGTFKPEIIVIHIMAGSIEGTDSWFADPASQVSAHYGVGYRGEVHKYVNEEDTAWHAGRVKNPTFSLYKPGINPNIYTIGIEHEGMNLSVDSTPEQKKASAALIAEISTRWNIPLDRDHIIGHYQIFSDKPYCPGTDKSVIDELIKMAIAYKSPIAPGSIAEGIAKIEEGIAIVKKNLK